MGEGKTTGISRQQALAAVAVKTPALATEQKGGKVHVTIEYVRPRWQRWLGAEATCRRTFALDAYGHEVYAMCDGTHSADGIIEQFASRHHLARAEAEVAVSAFLKTLTAKGLVGMAMVREK